MQRFWLLLIPLIMVSTGACATGKTESKNYMATSTKKDSFESVRDAVKLAITDRGLVINNVSHIGNMLARTGKDLGAKKEIYKHAEALEFCSASVSRATMEADPHNIVFCPYVIAVYEITTEPGTIYISYRRPEIVGNEGSQQALKAVEKLLADIVRDTLEW
ncbi:MAG: DUF302 domain-containing protein [Gammaproteobacteria bacterium]|nr:DUF302 domain-containing protein [Gammaproteobacteria bacterium]